MATSAGSFVWYELNALEVEYWYDVDMRWGSRAHEFYVEDGAFSIGARHFHGREEIAAFYAWRKNRGARTARHTFTNARVSDVTDDRALFEAIMLLYAADGEPVHPAQPPIMIADVVNRYVRVAGEWKLRSRTLRPLFEGGVGVTLPPDGEKR
jgi:hypothetical protein